MVTQELYARATSIRKHMVLTGAESIQIQRHEKLMIFLLLPVSRSGRANDFLNSKTQVSTHTSSQMAFIISLPVVRGLLSTGPFIIATVHGFSTVGHANRRLLRASSTMLVPDSWRCASSLWRVFSTCAALLEVVCNADRACMLSIKKTHCLGSL